VEEVLAKAEEELVEVEVEEELGVVEEEFIGEVVELAWALELFVEIFWLVDEFLGVVPPDIVVFPKTFILMEVLFITFFSQV